MAFDYYVDSRNGHDPAPPPAPSGDGTSGNPWRTITPVLAALAHPIVQTTTIHLAGSLTVPGLYDYGTLALSGVQCLNNSQLIWQPWIPSPSTEWNNTNYLNGLDPLSSLAPPPAFDPTKPKTCMFSGGVSIDLGSNNVVFRGIEIAGGLSQGLTTGAVAVNDGSRAQFVFCRFDQPQASNTIGVLLLGDSTVTIENCYVTDFSSGIVAMDGVDLSLNGANWIVDCGAVGLAAFWDSRVGIQPFLGGVLTLCTTTIQTASPRGAYKAVWAVASKIVIPDLSLIGVANRGLLQIIKQDLHGNDEYYGVVLEAQSLLLGAKLVMFTNPALATYQPAFETVPRSRQIVKAAGQGCIVTD